MTEAPDAAEFAAAFDDGDQGADVKLPDPKSLVGREGLLTMELVRAVEKHAGPFASDESQRVYQYADGVWNRDGARAIREATARLTDDLYRSSYATTAIDVIANRPAKFTEDTIDTRYLNVPNGLLDWRTGRLRPHHPAVPSMARIPVTWDETATCPAITKWIGETFPEGALDFAAEIIGYAMLNDNPLHKALLLHGTGRNGKGTFLRLCTSLVGRDNVSSVTPQSLDDNRFRAAELYGKLANLVGDVDPRVFKATETFKQVTGGDRITAERKNGQPFQFTCRALMVAAFNELPTSADATEGFFSRWIVLPFTGYFPPGTADTGLDAKLNDSSELRGLLVLAARGLRRLMERGRFAPPASVEKATSDFRAVADPVRAFLADFIAEKLLCEFVPRTPMYEAYQNWTTENGHKPLASGKFYQRVISGIDTHRVYEHKRDGVRGFKVAQINGNDGPGRADRADRAGFSTLTRVTNEENEKSALAALSALSGSAELQPSPQVTGGVSADVPATVQPGVWLAGGRAS